MFVVLKGNTLETEPLAATANERQSSLCSLRSVTASEGLMTDRFTAAWFTEDTAY